MFSSPVAILAHDSVASFDWGVFEAMMSLEQVLQRLKKAMQPPSRLRSAEQNLDPQVGMSQAVAPDIFAIWGTDRGNPETPTGEEIGTPNGGRPGDPLGHP